MSCLGCPDDIAPPMVSTVDITCLFASVSSIHSSRAPTCDARDLLHSPGVELLEVRASMSSTSIEGWDVCGIATSSSVITGSPVKPVKSFRFRPGKHGENSDWDSSEHHAEG
eukprot:2591731-Amphidinium_carterae.1